MQQFILLYQGMDTLNTPQKEVQERIGQYNKWVETLGEKHIAAQRLEKTGRKIERKSRKVLTDGPFLEAKEIIAGFTVIEAPDMEAATKLALESPVGKYCDVIIRPLIL